MINYEFSSSHSLSESTSSAREESESSELFAKCSEKKTEISTEESCILEVHGGSISDRLAALQRSGSENWKKRLGGRPVIERKSKDVEKKNTPVMRPKDKPPPERPHSLLERIMKLGEAQDHWRSRVVEKDASKFTVAGKMGQMQYSPYESPILNRKRFTPKPLKIRSKTSVY